MSSLTYIGLSWGLVIIAALGFTYQYNPGFFTRYFPEQVQVPAPYIEEKKPSKRAKQKAVHAIRQGATNKKAESATSEESTTKGGAASAIQVNGSVIARTRDGAKTSLPRDEDGSMSNREFAMELKRAQSGTKLERKQQAVTQSGKRKREHGDSRVMALAPPALPLIDSPTISTETSSTTGRDGDDDLSSASSPRSRPVSTAETSRAGDVSDMLEPAAPKPMTLSIVGTQETRQKSKAQPAKFEVAETKKQRQRRLKREEQKAAVEQSNAAHELKKQQQMRTARIAEGSSAQTRTNSFQPPKENVWNKVAQQPPQSTQAPAPLLDTFEPSSDATELPRGAVSTRPLSDVTNHHETPSNVSEAKAHIGESRIKAQGASEREAPASGESTNMSWADEMTEEDRRMLGISTAPEPEPSWQSVTNKKNKKKPGNIDGDGSSDASSGRNRSNVRSTATEAMNGTAKRPDNLNRFHSFEIRDG